MFSQSSGAMELRVMNTYAQEDGGRKLFDGIYIGMTVVIGYYNGTLLYINMYGGKDSHRGYGERVLSVS